LRDLLRQIYVLVPVFDRQKHYWFSKEEVEKLIQHAEEWLPNHTEKKFITSRYLKYMRPLVNMAFVRLVSEDAPDAISDDELPEEPIEKKLNLNTKRLGSVVAALKSCGAKSVIDIGCGEGNFLSLLIKEKQFERIAGADVSHYALKHAAGKNGCSVRFSEIGDSDEALGVPTQMGVFTLCE